MNTYTIRLPCDSRNTESLKTTLSYKYVVYNTIRFLSFKYRVDWPPHSGYNGILGFFNIISVKNRRNYLILNFLFKLLNNEIGCNPLLENLNFKIDIIKTRNNHLFFLKHIKTNYILNSPNNILMSIGNSTHLDLFSCNINDIKNTYNLV